MGNIIFALPYIDTLELISSEWFPICRSSYAIHWQINNLFSLSFLQEANKSCKLATVRILSDWLKMVKISTNQSSNIYVNINYINQSRFFKKNTKTYYHIIKVLTLFSKSFSMNTWSKRLRFLFVKYIHTVSIN